jgi:acetate kinase
MKFMTMYGCARQLQQLRYRTMTIPHPKQPKGENRISNPPVQILVINSGSSSIKFSFFDAGEGSPVSVFEGEVSGIGSTQTQFAFRDAEGHDHLPDSAGPTRTTSMNDAIEFVARAVTGPEVPHIDAIGYRVVHPGAVIQDHQRITDKLLDELRKAAAFAPLHDPAVIDLIEAMRRRFPAATHYACFDTVFHRTMPPEATTYPIPAEYAAQGVHRYGFHGLSCESIVLQLRDSHLPFPRRLAIAHLGSGASITALLDGKSIDTSMGLTPTGGIIMATRPGDLDPGLVLYLLRQKNSDADTIDAMLNHDSGLKALTGSSDLRTIRTAATHGDQKALLALRIFTRSITKALGSYLALLGGLDAIVFAGGIGEHDPASRAEILASLDTLNIRLDPALNTANKPGLQRLSSESAPTAIYVVPAEEDRMIARHVLRLSQTAC